MIRLDQISKQHRRRILFVDAGAAIHRGEKIGLGGPSGAGKSTVFRLALPLSTTIAPARRAAAPS